ncbi:MULTISPECIES: TIGR00341 family protein [Archaeoglobus]|nr:MULTISPECIES: TIGR00341 family protein [Archaeoglobus]AIG97660.1 hypothetical protein AFULGI_00008650 [Archaeoglobus fulgidus DSM 8774]MDI3497845.1 hypothetical protein [Archaeoglobus sp.]
MRKIIVRGRKEDLEEIARELGDRAFIYDDRIELYVQDSETEELVSRIKDKLDLRYKESIIEVYKPEFVISPASRREKAEEKTPVEKLVEMTKSYASLNPGRSVVTAIAGVIALSGLIMNNAVIVIGAMLLAPLLGPIHGFAVNLSVGYVKLAFRSALNLLFDLFLTMVFSTLFAMMIGLVHPLQLTPEILLRTEVSPVYELLAVLLGFASILSLSRGILESLAGVAVSASLLPPAVATGILLVISPPLAVKSLTLTLQNVAGLMAGSLAGVYVSGIRAERYYEKKVARAYLARSLIALTLLLIALLFLSILAG